MKSRRLLTETSTPADVAGANDLLREIRLQQDLVEAWESGRCMASGASWDPGTDPAHPDNPYTAGLQRALDRWEEYRNRHGAR